VESPNGKSGKEKRKIIVLGDSHVKALAIELKRNLEEKFEILGRAKPGSRLANAVNTPCSDLKILKRLISVLFGEVLTMWDGMRLLWAFVR
jgi:hypothetical protein